MDAKRDEFTTGNTEETETDIIMARHGGEEKFVFVGRKLWRIATEEFYTLSKSILDMQYHLSIMNNLSTAEDIKQATIMEVNENPMSSSLADFFSLQWSKVVQAHIATDDLNICYTLAHSHLQLKNYEQALELYQRLHDDRLRLTEYGVKLTEVYRGMGRCNNGMGKLREAKKAYELALEHSYPTQQSHEESITVQREISLNSLTEKNSPVEKAVVLLETAKVLMQLFSNRVKPLQMLFKVLKELILYAATGGKCSDQGLIEGFDQLSLEGRLKYVNNPSREEAHCVYAIGEIFAKNGNKDISQQYFTKSRCLGLKLVIDKNVDGNTKAAILTDLAEKFGHRHYVDTASEISKKLLTDDDQRKAVKSA
jgi:tetratricopeptide (TPR) repeat protein